MYISIQKHAAPTQPAIMLTTLRYSLDWLYNTQHRTPLLQVMPHGRSFATQVLVIRGLCQSPNCKG